MVKGRGARGADPHDYFSAEELARASAADRPTFRFIENAVFVGALVVVSATRVGPRVADAIDSAWPVKTVTVAAVVYVLTTVVAIPFDIGLARHRRAWDLERRSWADWLRHEVVSNLAVAAGFIAFSLAVAGLARSTPLWWAVAGGGGGAAAVILNLLAYRGRMGGDLPLDDRELLRRLVVLSREAEVPATGVWVRHDSGTTGRTRAYLVGYGRRRRIVVSDTLLALGPRVIEASLAHRIAQVRRLHTGATLAVKAVGTAVAFFVADLTVNHSIIRRLTGTDGITDPAALPLVLVSLSIGFPVVIALTALYVRARERRFTLDALDITRDADACEAAIRETARANAEPLQPRLLHRLLALEPPPAERLAIVDEWRRTRRLAVVFTDIVSSTDLLEALGERAWYELLAEHNEIVRSVVAAFEGTEVDNPGDGFLITFADTGQAVLAALEMQRRFADLHPPIEVRIGIHAGDVIRRGSNIYGREVHFAARIGSSARGGEVLVSQGICDELDDAGRFRFGARRQVTLKGFEGDHVVVPALGLEDVRAGQGHEPADIAPEAAAAVEAASTP